MLDDRPADNQITGTVLYGSAVDRGVRIRCWSPEGGATKAELREVTMTKSSPISFTNHGGFPRRSLQYRLIRFLWPSGPGNDMFFQVSRHSASSRSVLSLKEVKTVTPTIKGLGTPRC